ncbi:MAG: hypothetical protein KDD25_04330, partial [Bdellovibrionales bacterium]|nr:hypothetical protein [Bdellovibrionales bacterium]
MNHLNMKPISIIVLLFVALFQSDFAKAEGNEADFFRIEANGLAGFVIVDPTVMNKYLDDKSIREVYITGLLGANAQFVVGGKHAIGLGVRWDWNSIEVTGADGGADERYDMDVKRLAGVVSLRPYQNKWFFVGLIGTGGFQHDARAALEFVDTDDDDNDGDDTEKNETIYKSTTAESFSGGV